MRLHLLWMGIVLLSTSAFVWAADPPVSDSVSFTKQIAPLFVEHCVGCHNAKTKKGKYDMSAFEALLKGGSKGEAIKPGEPDDSLLVLMMRGDEEPAMPKDADLLDASLVAVIERWIQQGAKNDAPDPKMLLTELVPGADAKSVPTDYTTPVAITALAFHPNGMTLAAPGYHEITLWNAATGELQGRIPTRSERIHALAFTPDGTRLIHAGGTPGRLGEVVVWDAAEHKVVHDLFRTDDVVFTACLSPDGKQVAAGGADRIFRVWDLASGSELHRVENHADWVLGVTYSADGHRLLSASRDKSAKIWDQSTKEPILTFPKHTDAVFGVGFSPDGKRAYSAGTDTMLRIWDTSNDANEIKAVPAHAGSVHCVLLSKSGKLLLTAGADQLVKAWDPANGNAVRQFQGHTDWVYSLAISADEKRIASGAWDGEIRIWDAETGGLVLAFKAVPTLALSKAKSPPTSAP